MNKVWFFMMMASLVLLFFVNPSAALSEMLNASSGALKLCVELVAVYAVWLGLLELVDEIDNAEIEKMIALNMSANMLGLGNAATPMGIKAMQALDDGSGVATTAMIMLIVLNATSIQLLPSTVIGLRSAAGSSSPADIVLPTLIATMVTSVLGITLVKLISSFPKRRKR